MTIWCRRWDKIIKNLNVYHKIINWKIFKFERSWQFRKYVLTLFLCGTTLFSRLCLHFLKTCHFLKESLPGKLCLLTYMLSAKEEWSPLIGLYLLLCFSTFFSLSSSTKRLFKHFFLITSMNHWYHTQFVMCCIHICVLCI